MHQNPFTDPIAGRGPTTKGRGGGERGEREEGKKGGRGEEERGAGENETRHTNLSLLPASLDVSILLQLYLKLAARRLLINSFYDTIHFIMTVAKGRFRSVWVSSDL